MAGRLVTFLALATVLVLVSAANAADVDTEAPTGAVGGVRSQATGTLTLWVEGRDAGSGLGGAAVALDGVQVDEASFECPDPPAVDCPPKVAATTLEVPTTEFPDGPHVLTVTVRDAAGNVREIHHQTVIVANTPPKNTSTVTVNVGSGRIRAPSGSNGGGPVGPAEKRCASPRLEVFLASRPLRIRKGLPVLAAGHKYRWRGKLTCRIDGKRRAAPRGTVVRLRTIAHGRVVSTRKLKVGRRGRISVRLSLRRSRVLVFRFSGTDGKLVRVRMRVRVVRLKLRRGRATAAAAGGLSITPAVLEHTARRGVSDAVEVVNSSDRKLKVRLAARPWRQSGTGTVAADRRRTLSRFVRVSDASFALKPGARRTIDVTLTRVPSRDSLYGNIEVIGRPVRTRKGVNVAYRLVGSLRFNPPAADRKLRLRAGKVRVTRDRSLTLRVRNAGNTIDAVGGDVVIRGPRGGRSRGIRAVKILPGKRVSLALASLSGLRPDRYTAAVTLTQRGRNRLSVTRHFRVSGS